MTSEIGGGSHQGVSDESLCGTAGAASHDDTADSSVAIKHSSPARGHRDRVCMRSNVYRLESAVDGCNLPLFLGLAGRTLVQCIRRWPSLRCIDAARSADYQVCGLFLNVRLAGKLMLAAR